MMKEEIKNIKTNLQKTDNESLSVVEAQVIQPNSFINGDCMEFMRTCPPNFFDLAIVDPEYGIGFDGHDQIIGRGGVDKGFNNKKLYTKKNWDASPPPLEYFEQLFRISKNQIIWGGNYFTDKLPVSKGWIFWDKKPNAENLTFSDGELAWTSFDKLLKKVTIGWIGFEMLNSGEKKIHPTQKPVLLYKWLLKNYAKAGDLILDTHVGSASSLIACVELGYDYVGFEIDKEYYTMAKSRLGRATRKYELFEAV